MSHARAALGLTLQQACNGSMVPQASQVVVRRLELQLGLDPQQGILEFEYALAGTHPGAQLVYIAWLGKIVIRPSFQAGHDIFLSPLGGAQQQILIAATLLTADPAAQLSAFETR